MQGHRDREKHMMVHNASTARPASFHLLLSIAAMRDFQLWYFDVTKPYVERIPELTRSVYVRPPRELDRPDTHLRLLRKALYGLSDSGDYSQYSLDKVLREDVDMKPSTGDPALYYDESAASSWLDGIVVTQVDDVLRTGLPPFHQRSMRLELRVRF